MPKQSLSLFVETNNDILKEKQLKIISAIENSLPIHKISDITTIVAGWRMYLGINVKENSENLSLELAIVRDFIKENFNHLTGLELELAYKLAAKGELKDCEFYGYFTPFYVGSVLNSYLYYRKITLADPIKRKEDSDLIKESKPTKDEEAIITKQIFSQMYEQNAKGQDITDVFNICWNYLRKKKLINPNAEEIENAKKYAKLKIDEKRGFLDHFKMDKEKELLKLARNYCVQKYFDRTELNEVLENIKPEDF